MPSLQLTPIEFPPAVFARVAPDLLLQRHLAAGSRPCGKAATEFRPTAVTTGVVEGALGLATVRAGGTTAVATISAGTCEGAGPARPTVYPVVEIARGRVGAPTDEEMVTSQRLSDLVLHAGLLSRELLLVKVGDLDPAAFHFVLTAHVQVFLRVGPVEDVCWRALVAALRNTVLPDAIVDEQASAGVGAGLRGVVRPSRKLLMLRTGRALELGAAGVSLSFGVSGGVVLAELEGEGEEQVEERVEVVVGEEGFSRVSIRGGVTVAQVREAMAVAARRAEVEAAGV